MPIGFQESSHAGLSHQLARERNGPLVRPLPRGLADPHEQRHPLQVDVFAMDAQHPGHPERALLLPSNGMGAPFYVPLAEELGRRGMRTTLVTLPGYDGVAPLPDPTWSAMVDAVLPLVEDRDPDVLIGHSLGGLLAVLVAHRLGPVGPRRLVLMEPAVLPWAWMSRGLAWFYRRRTIDTDRSVIRNTGSGFRRMADPATYSPEMLAWMHEAQLRNDVDTQRRLAETFGEVQPLPLEAVETPTLLIRGDLSGWTMRVAQWGIGRRMPAARVVVFAGAAHWMANEDDARLATIICDDAR